METYTPTSHGSLVNENVYYLGVHFCALLISLWVRFLWLHHQLVELLQSLLGDFMDDS